ncbi:hypothetical protein EZV62_025218 [Acer yangbiense]|uniref:Uncharacterized protein n=1 Tax=Acer yangbiense TaxID=1000413 RepID=A0A5C7GX68_9ROSI|nr:hypothetical protein EZV62_025218 [Acer yangbiense]
MLTVKGQHGHYDSVKLFVFGDSYVDTGNLGKFSPSWKEPYGLSFPGKPSGQFSDGRILTDYIASYFGIKSPVPFERRNITRKSGLEYGMNFAYGGTGVFKTLVDQPNMTIQIDHFQEILDKNVYTKQDLNKSVALVSVAGNDYTTFIATNGSLQYMPDFTKKLVKQLAMDLKRIKGLGVENVLVTAVEPLGCYPALTAKNSYQKCIEVFNSAAQFHNLQLKDAVNKLNTDTNIHNSTASSFIFLNVYGSFMSALNKKHFKGKLEVKNPLEPCCVGLDDKYSCGSVDDKGVKKYSDLQTFTKSIISQLVLNLKSITWDLGVQKIVEPMGCLPRLAAFSSYKNCSDSWNSACMFHNQILQQELQNLNHASDNSVFLTLDIYCAFLSALKRQAN